MYYGKGFNGDDSICIKEGDRRVVDFIPVGREDEFVEVDGGWIHKRNLKNMQTF